MREKVDKLYSRILLSLLGITRLVSKAEVSLPSKWITLIDNIRISSDIVHTKLSTVDKEVEKEFYEKEEIMEKKLGNKKFYSEEELDYLKSKKNDISFHIPNF